MSISAVRFACSGWDAEAQLWVIVCGGGEGCSLLCHWIELTYFISEPFLPAILQNGELGRFAIADGRLGHLLILVHFLLRIVQRIVLARSLICDVPVFWRVGKYIWEPCAQAGFSGRCADKLLKRYPPLFLCPRTSMRWAEVNCVKSQRALLFPSQFKNVWETLMSISV